MKTYKECFDNAMAEGISPSVAHLGARLGGQARRKGRAEETIEAAISAARELIAGDDVLDGDPLDVARQLLLVDLWGIGGPLGLGGGYRSIRFPIFHEIGRHGGCWTAAAVDAHMALGGELEVSMAVVDAVCDSEGLCDSIQGLQWGMSQWLRGMSLAAGGGHPRLLHHRGWDGIYTGHIPVWIPSEDWCPRHRDFPPGWSATPEGDLYRVDDGGDWLITMVPAGTGWVLRLWREHIQCLPRPSRDAYNRCIEEAGGIPE